MIYVDEKKKRIINNRQDKNHQIHCRRKKEKKWSQAFVLKEKNIIFSQLLPEMSRLESIYAPLTYIFNTKDIYRYKNDVEIRSNNP